METNPELAHMLNDPAMLRQSMQLAANPALMQQQMRQNDQAMSNIQSTPEGFNALRSLYQNVQARCRSLSFSIWCLRPWAAERFTGARY